MTLAAEVPNGDLTGSVYGDARFTRAFSVSMPDASYRTAKTIEKPPSLQATDLLGHSIAAVGNNILVGARYDDSGANDAGAAYLFHPDGGLLKALANPTPAGEDDFGFSVAGVGNNILVGAPGDDTDANDAGAAYLFDGATGSLLRTFLNPTPDPGDSFGISVAAVGNNIVVGASNDDTGATNAGAAYLFDGTSGSLLRTFLNPTPADHDVFGHAVADVGGSVLVGAFRDDTVAADSGSAYLFDASTGLLLRTILNPASEAGDWFGFSIAGVGANAIIGAPFRDVGATTNAGAAYLFDGTSGSRLRTFPNPTPATNDWFGFSVASSVSNILVGAVFDDGGATDSGSAYLFDGTSGSLLRTFLNPTPAQDDNFGYSVAFLDDLPIVGAPYDDAGAANAGAAHLLAGNTGVLLQTFQKPAPAADDGFGFSVAAVGNNILVGAPGDDTGATNAGAAYLFDGNTGNLLRMFLNPTPAADDLFGVSVAAIGNNILVGSPGDDTVAENAGAVYLFEGTTGDRLMTIRNPGSFPASDGFGWSVAGAENRIIVGTAGPGAGALGPGRAFLFEASSGRHLRTLQSPVGHAGDLFGWSVAFVGTNILVGAPNTHAHSNPPEPGYGEAYLFDGTGTYLRGFPNPTPESEDIFGRSVAGVGSNVLVGAPKDDTGRSDAGAVYLFDAANGNLIRTIPNPRAGTGEFFGSSVITVGNNILVGAPGDDIGAPDAGAAFLFEAATGDLALVIENPTPATDDHFGASVAAIQENLMIGAPNDDVRDTDAGAVYVVEVVTQDDCGSGDDAGNSFETATSVSTPTSCSGLIGGDGDVEDWYQISASSGQTINAEMSPPSHADFDLELYHPNGGEPRARSTRGTGETDSVSLVADSPGNWRVRIYQFSGTGTYSLAIEVIAPPPPGQDDCGSGDDAGNSFETATPVTTFVSCIGEIKGGDPEDWYQFSVPSSEQAIVTLYQENPNGDYTFEHELYDPSGHLRATCPNHDGIITGNTECGIAFRADVSGSWRVRVYQIYGTGLYVLWMDVVSPLLTTTTVSCENPAGTNYYVCTATVADVNPNPPWYGTPSGTVSFTSSGTGTFTGSPCTLINLTANSASCDVTYTPTVTGTGTHTITANYGGDATHEPSPGSTDVTVPVGPRPTITSVSCSPPSVTVNEQATCTAIVSGIGTGTPTTPTGTVSFSTSGTGSFKPASDCLLSGSNSSASCPIGYTPSADATGTHLITATYLADAFHEGSSGSFDLTVNKRNTLIAVGCGVDPRVVVNLATFCTASVTDISSGARVTPSGSVTFTSGGSGTVSTNPCVLRASGPWTAICDFFYTPISVGTGTHTVVGSYSGNSIHGSSSAALNLTVNKRATTVTLACTLSSPVVNQATICTVTIEDSEVGTIMTPSGSVSFGSDSPGSFSPASCSLTGSGPYAGCSVDYTPTAAGTGSHIISAHHLGDENHVGSTYSSVLRVDKRATTIIVSCDSASTVLNQAITCTATVRDNDGGSPVTPLGSISFGRGGDGDFIPTSCTLSGSGASASCSVSYLPRSVGTGTVFGTYEGDINHLDSFSSDFDLTVLGPSIDWATLIIVIGIVVASAGVGIYLFRKRIAA